MALSQYKEAIQTLVNGNRIQVFSKTFCPFCQKAKARLTEYGLPLSVTELDQKADMAQWQDALKDLTGQRTVPSIWIDTKFIEIPEIDPRSFITPAGGSDALEKLYSSGDLTKLLRSRSNEVFAVPVPQPAL